jgi:Ankyrin repeats (3 copies)/Ankyrin repeats (many copies)
LLVQGTLAYKTVRFLLARLHVDSLLDKRTKQKVLSTLEKLSKGSAALDEAYSDAIKRIDGQLAEDRSLARRTISWISYAQRPLTAQELCHALAVEPGDRALNADNVHDVEDVVSVCAGLVTIDEESNVIRLVHYTTQDYFERIRLEWNPSAREEIASTCLTYLAFDTFQCGNCRSDEDFEERIGKSILLEYAAQYWAEHVLPIEEMVSELAFAFLRDDALVSSSTQVISVGYKHRGYSQGFPQSTTGLHLSARFGLVYLSRMLLTVDCKETSICADLKDSHSSTPLSWAARGGHEAVVKLLVETGKVDVDSKVKYHGRTPLSLAAEKGHEAVVKLLVETGKVDVDSKDSYGRTPLSLAAGGGHEAAVKLLVDTGKVDVDSKDSYGRTPLLRAAGGGHGAVVKLLQLGG